MLQCMAGDRFVRNVGDEVELPDDEAGRLVAAGFAVEVAEAAAEAGEKKSPKTKKKVAEAAAEVADS